MSDSDDFEKFMESRWGCLASLAFLFVLLLLAGMTVLAAYYLILKPLLIPTAAMGAYYAP